MPTQDESAFQQEFSSIFRPMLNAVEARRRRYRIEKTLGRLPEAPAKLPEPSDPSQHPLIAEARPSLEEIQKRHQSLEAARAHLASMRRLQSESDTPDTAPSSVEPTQPTKCDLGPTLSPQGPDTIAEAAREYHRLAQEWYKLAQHYQSPDTEQAEAIRQVAANALAEAAVEVRREALPIEESKKAKPEERRSADGRSATPPSPMPEAGASPEAAAWAELRELFGQVLAWERKAKEHLEKLGALDEKAQGLAQLQQRQEEELRQKGDRGQKPNRNKDKSTNAALADLRNELDRTKKLLRLAQESAPEAAEGAAQAKYYLALAEQNLFRNAAVLLDDAGRPEVCWLAADAAAEGVQRRKRDWDEIRDRRTARQEVPAEDNAVREAGPPNLGPAPAGRQEPSYLSAERDALAQVRKEALNLDLVGLAFSGGGIRSATFCLGILQGLAQLRLLGMIDFLSTVSGGGYIGSWFAAWVRREGSLINVEKQLSPNRVSQARASRFDAVTGAPLDSQPRDEEPEPVHHLRAYSRYLSPRAGLFSPDTWTLMTIYVRNLFVNALFFLPLAFAIVFTWKSFLHGYDAYLGPDLAADHLQAITWGNLLESIRHQRLWLTFLFLVSLVLASGSLAWAEENLYEADRERRLRDDYAEAPQFTLWFVLLPFAVMSLVSGWILSLDGIDNLGKTYEAANKFRYFGQNLVVSWLPPVTWAQFAIAFGSLSLGPSLLVRVYRWIRRCRIAGAWRSFNWRGLFANLLLATAFGLALFFVLREVIWRLSFTINNSDLWPSYVCLLHAIGLPLVFGAVVLGGFVEMAVLGRLLTEYEREWRARMAAILVMGATAWLLMAVVVFLVPWAFATSTLTGTNLKALLTGIWAAISAGGAWIARRAAPPGGPALTSTWARVLMFVAPIIFLIGLFGGVAALGQDLVESTARNFFPSEEGISNASSAFASAVSWPLTTLYLILAAIVLFVIFGFLINVNRFSMHMLYANRLTRCYLGASARKLEGGSRGAPTGVHEPGRGSSEDRTRWPRQANRFTGFDPLDDFPLCELLVVGGSSAYTGPIPLINCAINCMAGNELAYQDRRADSFLMTADWCGGRLTGYARTPRERRRDNNLFLGRVMTISGAAVDPNMNVVSPPLTALMTLFNTRLGWWIENPDPRRRTRLRRESSSWTASEPALGARLLWEFLGLTDESSRYVHLSDGGHFENLGVYELIHQRCRFIIVADAGTDRVAASDNMAAMLRLIRTDFGIRVELDPARMQIAAANGYSAWHCCVGRIRYDEVDEEAVPGLLVYLQATLTGDEPPDLLQYVSRNPSFPRQSTVNQFFDEAQFEAYRALGHHVATQVFGDSAAAWTSAAPSPAEAQKEVRSFFARVRQQWLEPLGATSDEWLAAANAALELERHFDRNAELIHAINAMYPEVNAAHLAPFQAVNQTLQVMELAWNTMRLSDSYAHPDNRGWMNVFRRWTASKDFHRYWPFLRAEYSRPFVSFCEEILNLLPTAPRWRQLASGSPIDLDLQEMNEQFAFEWSERFDLLVLPAAGFPRKHFIRDMLPQAIANPNTGRPLAWVICQGPKLPCGLACVARTPRQGIVEEKATPPDEAEFFIWLRGPYRSMGIGRTVAANLLDQIVEACAFWPKGQRLRYLVAYYPMWSGSAGPDTETERWMDFFFDLGFRRYGQPEQGPGAKFVIVKRKI